MALAHLRMSIHEFFNKDPDIFPEEGLLIILCIKSDVCMTKNGKDTNHIRHIYRRVHLSVKYTRFTGMKEVCNGQTL